MVNKKQNKPAVAGKVEDVKLDGSRRPVCVSCGEAYEGKDADLCPKCDRILTGLLYARQEARK